MDRFLDFRVETTVSVVGVGDGATDTVRALMTFLYAVNAWIYSTSSYVGASYDLEHYHQ